MKLYKATLPSVNYIFKNGKPAIFVRGRFSSSVEAEVAELDAEIAAGHPHIYIDAGEPEVETASNDLLAGLEQRLRAEIKAEMAAANDLSNDRGTSEPTKLMPASTVDVASAASGSGPSDISSKLVNLKAGK